MIRYSEWNDLVIGYINNKFSYLPKKHAIGINLDTCEIVDELPRELINRVKAIDEFKLENIGTSIRDGLECFKKEIDEKESRYFVNVNLNIRDCKIAFSDGKVTNYYHSVGRVALCRKGDIYYRDVGIQNDGKKLGEELIKVYYSMLEADNVTMKSPSSIQNVDNAENIYIMSSQATAFFVHELIGHMFEKDNWSNNISLFKQQNKILPSYCNVIDSPDESEFLKYGKYDDVGNEIREIRLINEGYINDIIDTMRSAEYSQLPIYRMVNLHMLANPNGDKLADMVAKYKKCIVIEEVVNGGINTFSGDFFLLCGKLYYSGECNAREYLKPVTVYGNIRDITNNVIEVGCDFGSHIGICSKKGQNLYVNTGAPSMVISSLKYIV